jgi:ATP-dependent Clp protease ATP-binding subunit ClpA
MRRAIARHLDAPLAELLLGTDLHAGDVVMCDVRAGAIEFDVVHPGA